MAQRVLWVLSALPVFETSCSEPPPEHQSQGQAIVGVGGNRLQQLD
jgi:hypothetical protein